ncbi:MAG: homoserine dehydrogenase [Coriobacteriales bacterium]|jgi:homoserine dehydrogenase|nr:homoserine dehydrogenase [Coriobacteriales bacterium]
MKIINIGILGLGVVGSGVVRILQNHHGDFLRDQEIDLRLIAVSSRRDTQARELGLLDIYSPDTASVTANPRIDVVLELMGGIDKAYECVKAALESGKSVVTANKALIATHGRELMRLAGEHAAEIAFEASVGGGIPIIGPLRHTLASNRILSVMGIVNGTTNYMLGRMSDHGLDYASALAEAQALGYAEADPTADVEGLDAAAKIAILSMIAFNTDIRLDQVKTEGISKITTTDIQAAAEAGYTLKLLAIAQRQPTGIDIRVHPTMIKRSHPLASVSGVFNAIYVVGDAVGETMFYGRGAGADPTASSVVGDLIELARHRAYQETIAQPVWDTEGLPILDDSVLESTFYLRLPVMDKPGTLAASATIFADLGISIASMVQHAATGQEAELIYFTHQAPVAAVMTALDRLIISGILTSPASCIYTIAGDH